MGCDYMFSYSTVTVSVQSDLIMSARPEAVAYKFYGWLRDLCGWLASSSRLN